MFLTKNSPKELVIGKFTSIDGDSAGPIWFFVCASVLVHLLLCLSTTSSEPEHALVSSLRGEPRTKYAIQQHTAGILTTTHHPFPSDYMGSQCSNNQRGTPTLQQTQ